MKSNEIMDLAEENLIHTYNRYKIVMDRGDGVYIYDKDGKEYLDFGAGIAVFALGYNNKEYNEALKEQIDKLIHTSNFFYNEPAAKAAEVLTKATGMEKVFFTNSGTEAVEGAIKIAKKYGKLKDGRNDHEIIAMKNSFHGRSYGSLSVTGNTHYQEDFAPMIPGIKFAQFNNLDSVKELINDRTSAIIMETVQGEGGIYPADPEFIKGVRKLADDNDLLLILDEIQCGMGRTGTMFAYQDYGVVPDVVTVAKALGLGVPVGAFLARGKAAQCLVPGDHGSTYGGNPLVGTAIIKAFELFEKNNIADHVKETAPYLEEKLDEIASKYDCIQLRRGKGFMQGLVFDRPVKDIIGKAVDNGLILFAAGSQIIRFVPPLIITKADIDEMVMRLEKAIDQACAG